MAGWVARRDMSTPTGGARVALDPPAPELEPMICPLCLGTSVPHAHLHGRQLHQCSDPGGCGLLFVDPAHHLDSENERARYETHQNDPADPRYRAFLGQATEPLLARLWPGATGLDFGCGPGPTLSRIMAEHGHPCRDYDPFFAPDEGSLAETYDFVTCTETVEHFQDPRAGFMTLASLLRPDGWLVVMTQCVPDPRERALGDWMYLRDPTHVAFFREETLAWIGRWMGWETHRPSPRVTLFRATVRRTSPGDLDGTPPWNNTHPLRVET
jgi:SAM-dependent methyltransferase